MTNVWTMEHLKDTVKYQQLEKNPRKKLIGKVEEVAPARTLKDPVMEKKMKPPKDTRVLW